MTDEDRIIRAEQDRYRAETLMEQALNRVAALEEELRRFRAACQGPDSDVSRLDWLSGLLSEITDTGWCDTTGYPDANYSALRESQALLRALSDLMKAAPSKAAPSRE